MNTIRLHHKNAIEVGIFDNSDFRKGWLRIEDVVLGICIRGSLKMELGSNVSNISENTIVFILEDSTLNISEVTDDFHMKFVKFTPILFWEASMPINPAFFGRIRSNPIVTISEFHLLEHYFHILSSCSNDNPNKYRITIARNLLQSIILDIYDCACHEQQDEPEGTTRQEVLFKQFVQLIVKHCHVDRDVCFYADHLCITPRYLSAISRNLTGMSAKGLIDKHAIIEIKSVLKSTTLDVQEIAYRFNFPNKSFFGRYFKKHTGMTPLAYRQEQ